MFFMLFLVNFTPFSMVMVRGSSCGDVKSVLTFKLILDVWMINQCNLFGI